MRKLREKKKLVSFILNAEMLKNFLEFVCIANDKSFDVSSFFASFAEYLFIYLIFQMKWMLLNKKQYNLDNLEYLIKELTLFFFFYIRGLRNDVPLSDP